MVVGGGCKSVRMGGGDREIEEGNETTEKRAKTIEQWTRPRRASESRNGDGDGSSERSTSRNGDETIDGATYDAIVMLLRLSVSKHARLGRARAKKKRLKARVTTPSLHR